MMSSETPLDDAGAGIVIIGAGLAGVKAAEGVRAAGFTGRLVLVSEERHAPYDRPPLSKQVLSTPGFEHQIALQQPDALEALKLELQLGRRAITIDRAAHQVSFDEGEPLGYSRLILATGSKVRSLPALPPGAPRVHYLRDLDDALTLRAALAEPRRVAVIGGGVIGLEVAAMAAQANHPVAVVEAGERLMARAACPILSDYLAALHRANGVELRLGVSLAAATPDGDAIMLELSDGSTLTADAVIVGIGVTPNAELAAASGLQVDPSGVVVDHDGRTSDPDIFAAGEVAYHRNARSEVHERQETWAHASAHGEHVGRAAVTSGEPYAELSSYWTDQYDMALQVLGQPQGEVDVLRGDPASGRFAVLHLAAGRVVGASAVNNPKELRAAKAMILSCARIAPELLADAGQELKTLAAAAS